MNTKKTIVFLVLTFIWSWIFWGIGLNVLAEGITQESISAFLIYFFTGVYGPSLSAVITTLIFDGFKAVLNLLKTFFIWNIPLKNYGYVIFLPILFVLVGIGLYAVFIGPIGRFDSLAYSSIPVVLWSGFYAGPLGEELGWRGFLLPEFQKRFSNLKSAIVIGVIWFVWHIPLFWAPFGTLVSGGELTFLPVITYLMMLICLSVIITWLVICSKGSVLIALLFHLSINAGIALLFFPELGAEFKTVHLLSGIGMLIFTIFIIVTQQLNQDTLEDLK